MSRISELPGMILALIVVSVTAAIGATILDKTKTEIATTGNATTNPGGYTVNTTIDDGIAAMGDITSWLGVVVIVVMGAIIIKLLFEAFGGR